VIKNINENYGDPITFETVSEMALAIKASGYELPADGLVQGRDYIKLENCNEMVLPESESDRVE